MRILMHRRLPHLIRSNRKLPLFLIRYMMSLALLTSAVPAAAQIYELHSNFMDGEFDRLLLRHQFVPVEKFIVPALTPFLAQFCGKSDLRILESQDFVCQERVCRITRYKWSMGAFTPNIARSSWMIKVNLSQSECPLITIEFGRYFIPSYTSKLP